MSQVCSKGGDRGHNRNQQCPPAIAPRSQPVFARSRHLLPMIAAAHPNRATVKTYSPALNADPGKQGRAVKLEGGVA